MDDLPRLSVVFYCSSSGREPVRDWLKDLLFVVKSAEMVLLHGFIKKTNATPGKDLQLAERRWKEWQDQEKGEEKDE